MTALDVVRYVLAAFCLGVAVVALVLAERGRRRLRALRGRLAQIEAERVSRQSAALFAGRAARDAQWGGRA